MEKNTCAVSFFEVRKIYLKTISSKRKYIFKKGGRGSDFFKWRKTLVQFPFSRLGKFIWKRFLLKGNTSLRSGVEATVFSSGEKHLCSFLFEGRKIYFETVSSKRKYTFKKWVASTKQICATAFSSGENTCAVSFFEGRKIYFETVSS